MFFYSCVDFSVLGNWTCTLGRNRLASRHLDRWIRALIDYGKKCASIPFFIASRMVGLESNSGPTWKLYSFLGMGGVLSMPTFVPFTANTSKIGQSGPCLPLSQVRAPSIKNAQHANNRQIVIIYYICVRGISSRITGSAPQSRSKAIVREAVIFGMVETCHCNNQGEKKTPKR